MASTLISDYLGKGLASARPASPSVGSGALALYYATDTLQLSEWNGSAWVSAGGTVSSVAASVPAFLSLAGSPITTSGTLAITLSGTALPVVNGGTGVTTSTGSGSNVLATSPALVTPLLGTPTSGNLANCTAYAFSALTGTATYAQLPSEVAQVPIAFVIPSKPTASQTYNIVAAMAMTVPANFSGTVSYQNTQATSPAAFSVAKISGGSTTAIGTITLGTASKTAITRSTQAQVSLAAGDVLQLTCPSVQDATMADCGITILCNRV